jgi:protein-S-isoprenylcysteine O-methyltransferase Ste14
MFFAFEALLVLFYLNIDKWLINPFSWDQVFSWFLAVTSAGFALSGFYALRKYGETDGDWEATTRLIQKGVFEYIRHPLYSSLMILAVGILFKDLTFPAIMAFLVALTFLVAASFVEEKENLAKFGVEYAVYVNNTRRYIPFVF